MSEATCVECDGPASCLQIRWCTRYGRVVSSSPSATLSRDEIERFRRGDILLSDEQANRFCDLALSALSETARFDGIVDDAKREADRRALQAAITDEDVEKALEAANGAMVDTRRHWTEGDRAAVRAMLEAVSLPSAIARSDLYPAMAKPIVHGQREQEDYRRALEAIIADPEADAVAIAHAAITPYTPWVAVDE